MLGAGTGRGGLCPWSHTLLCHLDSCGLGEERAQEKNIQELQGQERLLVQNSSLPQVIMVAVLQQSLAELWGRGYAQILPVKEWDCWGKERDWDALVTSAAKHRTQQRKRKTQGHSREGRRLQITSNGE